MLALGEAKLTEAHQDHRALSRQGEERHRGCRKSWSKSMAARCRKDRAALEELPGVGRKTANVVLNVAFGEPTIAVDTHIFRVSNRTGLAPGKDVLAVETGAREDRAGAIQAACPSLADPARALYLRRAQAAVPDLRGARPVPLQGQDQRTAGGKAEARSRRLRRRSAQGGETGACRRRSAPPCGRVSTWRTASGAPYRKKKARQAAPS